MRRLLFFPFVVFAFALGCGDEVPSTGPNAGRPNPAISDGAHGADGNDGFFFLPPMVKEPVGNPDYKDEPFHGGLQPVVTICQLATPTTCVTGDAFKTFTADQISVGDETYQVNWDTKEQPLVDGAVYRIQVFIGDVLLGYADVQHADTRSELKNVNTNEFVALVDGRTLPIKFRIETGALCEFDAVCTSTFVEADVGGTVYAADEGAAIDFDPGVLPVDVVVTVERVPVLPGAPCVGVPATLNVIFQQWEGCYRITTAPDLAPYGGFQGPTEGNPARAIVAVCIEPSVPEALHDNLLLYKFDEGAPLQRPEPVEPPFAFSCAGFEGTPSGGEGALGFARDAFGMFASAFTQLFGPRPLYAVDGGLGCILAFGDVLSTFFWGLPVTAAVSTGDQQAVPVGSVVPIAPSVRVTTFHLEPEGEAEPVSGVPVTFTVTGGGGTLLNAAGAPFPSVDVVTDASGTATLPTGWTWQLGDVAGPNTLVASGPFENGPVTFTAQAFVPVVQTLIACTPEDRGGDLISRGWYVPSFPGVSLTSVQLELLSRGESAGGDYTLDLTARSSAYNGPVIGTSRVIVTLDGASTPVPTTFTFSNPAIAEGSLVTFAVTMADGPAGSEVLYNVFGSFEGDPSCPIIETENTAPPLSTFRRQGIVATIVGGARPPVVE